MNPLDLPLAGVRLVEASAGTGKTFTIATLYLRLILARGLSPERIVVATFTRAATAELAMRLRQRLRLAADLLGQEDPSRARSDDDGEIQATRTVIAQALDASDPRTLAWRAREAELAMDTAAIGTLHAFCNRVLAEFGFETGRALAVPELLDDMRALEQEIVQDFWRRSCTDARAAHLLAETWRTPVALARQVAEPRWRGRTLGNAIELAASAQGAATRAEIMARLDALRNVIAGWDEDTLLAATQELGTCIHHAGARKTRVQGLHALREWARKSTAPDLLSTAARKALGELSEGRLSALNSCKRLPQGPVFAAVADLDANLRNLEQIDHGARARLLLDARAFLDRELPARLQALGLLGHDQAVDALAAALNDAERGAAAVRAIRERWQVALVDEFQDTDPKQWGILKQLFAYPGGALVLVGDPKQAIYGFRGGDVHAWLTAKHQADGEPLRLDASQRAGRGVNAGVNALFARAHAFVEPGIAYADVHAAARVAQRALLVDGAPAPGLQVWRLAPTGITNKDGSTRMWNKGDAQAQVENACVAQIVEWLAGARCGHVRLREGDGGTRALHACDIAVLVNSNREARSMQRALAHAGVPAASCLRASVYASAQAADLVLVLEALRVPADARRARAARASELLGYAAPALAATCTDSAALNTLLLETIEWAELVQRHGPLPLLHRLIARAAPRLLAMPGGERRVANYLQLAELLQEQYAECFGIDDLCGRHAHALGARAADTDVDAVRLRLDTDAEAVQIATLHAAKGLEYGVVLLPGAVSGHAAARSGKQPALTWYHEGDTACVAVGDEVAPDVAERAREEALAEEVRKFYVGVTRARATCVIPWGRVKQAHATALHWLLYVAGREAPLTFDETICDDALAELIARGEGEIVRSPLPAASAKRLPKPPKGPMRLAAAAFHGTPERDWQTWSFSRLVRGSANQAAGDPLPGTGDRDAPEVEPPNRYLGGLAGPRFGTAVHAVFERTDFLAWRDAAGIPDSERRLVETSLRDQAIADRGMAMAHAVDAVGACVYAALNTPLPGVARLCEIPPERRRTEIEFHLSLAPAHSAELYRLLHRYGYQQQRSGVAPARVHGLMTGKIDLVFADAGRYHIVDWKTNRCPPYDAAALRAAIDAHDYDLQWLIYTLALHRWLGQQIVDYDYDTHIGAAWYLFVRGMANGGGIHRDRPPRELIEAMDALIALRRRVSP